MILEKIAPRESIRVIPINPEIVNISSVGFMERVNTWEIKKVFVLVSDYEMDMVVWFRIDYKGVEFGKWGILYIHGCGKDEEEVKELVEREKRKPSFGDKVDHVVYYDSYESFYKDVLRESIIGVTGYDESLFVRCEEVGSMIKEDKRVSISNFFGLEEKVPIKKIPVISSVEEDVMKEKDKPEEDRTKEEAYIREEKISGMEEFKGAMNEKDISVIVTKDDKEADRKRIRFKAMGFEVIYFKIKGENIVLISIKEFSKEELKYIRDTIKSIFKVKIDVEIGLPEIEGEPEEEMEVKTEEDGIKALMKVTRRKKFTEGEVKAVVSEYKRLWGDILNRCYEYDEETRFYYKLRKDWGRMIRGISIWARGKNRLVMMEDNKYVFSSESEREEGKYYTVTIKIEEDGFILDSNDPDRVSDVVVGITIGGEREVERYITKHMVASILSLIHR
ncbi:MAG: hypothetical protein QW052_06185 [Candidatus Nitrosocaldaceae archaeon]